MAANTIYPVKQLYPDPVLNTHQHPDLILVLFHGISLGGNKEYEATWSTRDEGKSCWPRDWLPQDVGVNIRVLSLSYDASVYSVHSDVSSIGKNLIQSLICGSGWSKLWESTPIALIGYSFGGLVLKSMVVEARRSVDRYVVNILDREMISNCRLFLDNLKAITFYGVPHSGGNDLKEFFQWQYHTISTVKSNSKPAGIMTNLQTFSRQMVQLSVDFENSVKVSTTDVDDNIIIYAFAEGKPLSSKFPRILVPLASAQQLARRHYYKVEGANHLEVCMPTSKEDIIYTKVVEVLKLVKEHFSYTHSSSSSTPELDLFNLR